MDNGFNNTSYNELSGEKKGIAIAILVLGICSIVCCGCLGLVLAVISIILFVVNKDKFVESKKLAKAGLICAIVGVVVSIISMAALPLFMGIITPLLEKMLYLY